ncbi:MAG: YdiU family protein [Pirellulales bacterium]
MSDPLPPSCPLFDFDNSYARELTGFFATWAPARMPAPELLRFNRPLAAELGIDADALDSPLAARYLGGGEVPPGAQPIAQAYAGHQFGGFSPQLGDGRALLLGEVIDRRGRRRDIALKGSGPTPFSRGGDGKAAVGPVLREYLIGEGLHALGIPATRALAAVKTGETIRRERPLPGAVLTRVALSHLRVGTFEFFAAREMTDKVRRLADYTIARHDPQLIDAPDRYYRLLENVARRQAELIAQWMHVGFLHGVMNTDNMALSGESIDFGPCAFLEAYDPKAVFSSIDTNGRYSFRNQPPIARWNLARLAETLLPLFGAETQQAAIDMAMQVIDAFPRWYEQAWRRGVKRKLGLAPCDAAIDADVDDHDPSVSLAQNFLDLLERQSVDFTLAWRRLADAAQGDDASLLALFPGPTELHPWLEQWRGLSQSVHGADPAARTRQADALCAANPLYVPRNHLVEEALAAASNDADLAPFERLLDALSEPYRERAGFERYAEPAPRQFTACYQTFCGT